MENEKELLVSSEKAGMRIDVFVSEEDGITRSAVAKLIESEKILVNGAAVPKNYKIKSNDTVHISYPPVESCETEAENIALDIVYEDSDIVVINKPMVWSFIRRQGIRNVGIRHVAIVFLRDGQQ